MMRLMKPWVQRGCLATVVIKFTLHLAYRLVSSRDVDQVSSTLSFGAGPPKCFIRRPPHIILLAMATLGYRDP